MSLIERAARALCRANGNPENTQFEGRPMWESYVPEATAVLEATGHERLRQIAQRVVDWKDVGVRGPDWRGMEQLKADAAAALV